MYGRSESVATLVAVLSPLVLDRSTSALVAASSQGLLFSVTRGAGFVASARLDRSLFQEYACQEPDSFCVNLTTLVSVLRVFGPHALSSTVKLSWRGYGSDLLVVVYEGAMHTECSLRTLEADDPPDSGFRADDLVSQLCMHSDSLREAFAELDWSSPYVTITVSPDDAPHLRLATSGTAGSCMVEYSKSSPLFDSFQCRSTQRFIYRLNSLQPCVKALNGASKTQLQIDSGGVLLLQHLIKGSSGVSTVVDFFFSPSMGADEDMDPMGLVNMEMDEED